MGIINKDGFIVLIMVCDYAWYVYRTSLQGALTPSPEKHIAIESEQLQPCDVRYHPRNLRDAVQVLSYVLEGRLPVPRGLKPWAKPNKGNLKVYFDVPPDRSDMEIYEGDRRVTVCNTRDDGRRVKLYRKGLVVVNEPLDMISRSRLRALCLNKLALDDCVN